MIIDELHSKFPNMTDLRVREIVVDRRQKKVTCKLSYPDVQAVPSEVKSQLNDCVKSQIPQGFSAAIDYINDSFTVTSFTALFCEIIKNNYPIYGTIPKSKVQVAINGRKINVLLTVSPTTKQNMEISEFALKLVEYFATYTCYEVEIELAAEIAASIDFSEQERLVQLAVNRELLKPSRYFTVTNVRKHLGKEISGAPMYISDIMGPKEECIICGTVSGKSTKSAKNNNSMQVCKFTLTDASGASMPCVTFVKFLLTDVATIQDTTGKGEAEAKTLAATRTLANDKKMKLLMEILDGDSVIVHGKISFNAYSERLEMTVYDLAKCQIMPVSAHQTHAREVAKDYMLVRPEQYAEYQQTNFVFQPSQNSLLKGRSLVVLHANATGYSVIEDKIYAICGVKVTNGRVTERFFTYVNPEKEVDAKKLATCDLAQNRLSFYPTLTEIISDLYKFCYGCELVGTNLTPLIELLNYYAAPVGYQFGNETVLQTDILTQLIDNSILSVGVSVSKIDDLAKKCKVDCKNSAFCKDSALAVARCMSVLSDNAK